MPHTVAKRSSSDEKWQRVKCVIDKRDNRSCQFEKCLSAKEAYMLKVNGPKTLDRCHIFSAGSHPELIYNSKNVITLKRFIHHRLDSYKCPLTGEPLDANETHYWWHRILLRKVTDYDSNIDYELLLLNEIAPNALNPQAAKID
jgi:hypothetical protein